MAISSKFNHKRGDDGGDDDSNGGSDDGDDDGGDDGSNDGGDDGGRDGGGVVHNPVRILITITRPRLADSSKFSDDGNGDLVKIWQNHNKQSSASVFTSIFHHFQHRLGGEG